MCPPHAWVPVQLSHCHITEVVGELLSILWKTESMWLSFLKPRIWPMYDMLDFTLQTLDAAYYNIPLLVWRLYECRDFHLLFMFYFHPLVTTDTLRSLFTFFFLCLTGNPDKTSRKHITSTSSSNPEPRKESLALGTGVNESSLLLEVRNHMAVFCMCNLCNISVHVLLDRK